MTGFRQGLIDGHITAALIAWAVFVTHWSITAAPGTVAVGLVLAGTSNALNDPEETR